MAAPSLALRLIHDLEGTRSSCFKPLVSHHHTPPCKTPTPLKSPLWGAQLHLRNGDTSALSHSRVMVQVQARLFGPSIFEASKLNVLFLGEGKDTRPDELPRAYTLTHSDITSKLTLAVSQTINKAQIQGWYSRLQRDEVLAEWRKSQGCMSLHVHCHISGGHWLLDVIAHLRFYIFQKELPMVLEAFRYGDVQKPSRYQYLSYYQKCKSINNTFDAYFVEKAELEEALVWVYFHSNEEEYNRIECWGPLREAAKGCASKEERKAIHNAVDKIKEQRLMGPMDSSTTIMMESVDVSSINQGIASGDWKVPIKCPRPCKCCFPTLSVIPLPPSYQNSINWQDTIEHQQQQYDL